MRCVAHVYFETNLPIQAHPTLTYIDLRSNDISNVGLGALAGPLEDNSVLSLLDLRGNCVGQEAAQALSKQLMDTGSHLHVRWDDLDVLTPNRYGNIDITSVTICMYQF